MTASTSRSPEAIDDLRRRVAEIEAWYHVVDLGDGVVTPGTFDMAPYLERYHFPDMTGTRILDVGASNGYFSVEFERRGAAEVVALDVPSWESCDWTPRQLAEYLKKDPRERELIDQHVLRAAFELVVEATGSERIRKVESRIYDMTPDELGTFDIVFCGSMLMHVRDPVLGIHRMRALCKPEGRLIIAISTTLEDATEPIARFAGEWNQCNWWQMSPKCLETVLECCDFGTIEHRETFPVHDTTGQFRDPHFACHALPGSG